MAKLKLSREKWSIRTLRTGASMLSMLVDGPVTDANRHDPNPNRKASVVVIEASSTVVSRSSKQERERERECVCVCSRCKVAATEQ